MPPVKKKSVVNKNVPQKIAKEVSRQPMVDLLHDSMLAYGKAVVEDRAIPDYRDGLKPVQRRIIWAAHALGLKSSGSYRKSAKIVGDTMGGLHPHSGDSIYNAAALMTRGVLPLLDGRGNLGTITSPRIGAMRYTELRLHSNSERLLLDEDYLHPSVTQMVPTFDSKSTEPVVLPSKLPLSLLLEISGIAVGTTTEIPAFTLKSLATLIQKASMRAIKTDAKPYVTTKECQAFLEFAVEDGGVLASDEDAVKDLITNGAGRLDWICDYEWNEKQHAYIVSGLAPGLWNREGLDKLLENLGDLPGISRVDNLSSKGKRKIVITLMKTAKPDDVESKVEKLLSSAITYVMNFTERRRVGEDTPVPETEADFFNADVATVINKWFEWRIVLEKRKLKYEFGVLKDKMHREQLMMKACDNLEIIFNLLRKRGIDKNAELAKALSISLEDAKYVWSIAVGRLDRLSVDDIKARMADIRARAKEIQELVKQPAITIAKETKELALRAG